MHISPLKWPGHIAQLVASLTDEPEVQGIVPDLAHGFMEIDPLLISTVIFLR